MEGNSVDAAAADSYVYVANGTGVIVVDVSSPSTPSIAASIETPGSAQDLAVVENHVYVADGSSGLVILDISDPAAPSIVGSASLGVDAVGVSVDGGTAVLVGGSQVVTVDVADPANPVVGGATAVSGVQDLAFRNGHAHVAADSSLRYRVVDAIDPSAPANIAGLTNFIPVDVALSGDLAFFAEVFFTSAVPYANIGDPSSPVYQGFIDMSRFGDDDCRGIDVDANYTYCTAGRRLYVSQYRAVSDTEGVPPTVTLTAPVEGSVLQQKRPYRVKAEAVDDVRVAAVTFEVDGEAVSTDTAAPYDFVYKVPADSQGLTLRVTAIDLAGNEGSTAEIPFVVDELTVVDEEWREVTVDIFDDDLTAASVTIQGASFISSHKLTSVGDFVAEGIGNSSVTVESLAVGGDLVIDGTTLTVGSTSGISVLGNVRLVNGGRLTVPAANSGSRTLYPLELDVAGTVSIDPNSAIDISGKGYPANLQSGPDYSYNTRYACYGGRRSNTSGDCTYGRYERARFAGSAGNAQSSGAAHGGVRAHHGRGHRTPGRDSLQRTERQ